MNGKGAVNMRIGSKIIRNADDYENYYISFHKHTVKVAGLFGAVCALELIILTVITDWNASTLGILLGIAFKELTVFGFFLNGWHPTLRESKSKIVPAWLGWITLVMLCLNFLSYLATIPTMLVLYIEVKAWYLVVYFFTSIIMVTVIAYLFVYWRTWFIYFRWTWEELQIPVQERKRIYREKKCIRREEKRKTQRKNIQEKTRLKKDIVHSVNGEKSLKTQENRRSELENLKKLFEDGLIDEEEYKRAREKTLGIQ